VTRDLKFCFVLLYLEVVIERSIQFLDSNDQWTLETKQVDNKMSERVDLVHEQQQQL